MSAEADAGNELTDQGEPARAPVGVPGGPTALQSADLVRQLVAIPGPPGQEDLVRDAVEAHARALGYGPSTDAKGNLLVPVGRGAPCSPPRIVVTAHLDEIALVVTAVEASGNLRVGPLGGAHPWKWGEQPVCILAAGGRLDGVLSFGGIHTTSPAAPAHVARSAPLAWDHAWVFTGMAPEMLVSAGVRPGTRVTLAPERRVAARVGPFTASYFLDDRADLAAWLLALQALRDRDLPEQVLFAATAGEEVGGEGAAWLFQRNPPEVCIALEIGPAVPESPFAIDENPTIWTSDSFAAMAPRDAELLAGACASLGIEPHWQALSRGGSDASTAAQRGLAARPITLGLPVENSHGFEIMHSRAPDVLAALLVEVVARLGASPPTA